MIIRIERKKINDKWEKDSEHAKLGAAILRAENLMKISGENNWPKWDKVSIILEQPVEKYLKKKRAE